MSHVTKENLLLVSIIIPTKNEQDNIRRCLDSLQNQTFPKDKIEVIVVDNYSTDKTIVVVQSFNSSACIKIFNHGQERSAQRNFGAKKSRGQYLLFLDADMSLHPRVVEECVRKFDRKKREQRQKLTALYIPEIIRGNNFWTKARNFERSFYNQTPIDAVRFIRRDVFFDVGGFDENLTGPEDWDLDKRVRIKGEVDIISSVIYHNEINFNIVNFLNKKNYYAKSFGRYIDKWGKNDADIKKQLSLFYRFFGIFWQKGKWKKLVSHPILAVLMYVIKFLTGITYIYERRSDFHRHS